MTYRQINVVWDLVRTLDPEPLHLVRALDAHCTGQAISDAGGSTVAVCECLWADSCALAAEFVL